jgi:transcriptional regulator with XRE-family HTH domain
MISTYVRRRRLGHEIIALRDRHGMSGQVLAGKIGVARQRISRLENGHVRPDLDEIMRILSACKLEVNGGEWTRLVSIARDAQAHGWWERHADEMGQRQALCANLEAGANTILEYQMTFLPGLLQLPEFTQARMCADHDAYPPPFDPSQALQARQRRQQLVERPDGPGYEVIIDELAIRRRTAPPPVVAAQLLHIVAQGRTRPKLTVRVLPIDAHVNGYSVPRSAFFIYRYPEDPPVVMVDTVTSDHIVADPAEAGLYELLYTTIRDASLSTEDSLRLLAQAGHETRTAKRREHQHD